MSTTDSLPAQETTQDNPPELREYLKLRYTGKCICNCQLVPAKTIKHYADKIDTLGAEIEQLNAMRSIDLRFVSVSEQVLRVALDQLWNMLGASNQTEAVLALQARNADAERLTFVEAAAKKSRTGVSFDWVPSVDGERSGFRYMRHHNIGEPRNDVRTAIDVAMVDAK